MVLISFFAHRPAITSNLRVIVGRRRVKLLDVGEKEKPPRLLCPPQRSQAGGLAKHRLLGGNWYRHCDGGQTGDLAEA